MTMGHGHAVGHGLRPKSEVPGRSTPLWMRGALGVMVLAIATAAALGMWALRPTGAVRAHLPGLGFAAGVTLLHGQVVSVAPLDCSQLDFSDPTQPPRTPSKNARCGRAKVAISSGAESGHTVSVDLPPEVRTDGIGLRILVMKVPGVGQGSPYSFYDVERTSPLLALAALFVIVVVAVARGRGLRALLGLGLAAYVVVKYLLPALLEGHSPVQLGLVVSVAIMIVVLYLTHGVSTRTTTALLGTFAGLGITAVVGALAVTQVHLTGVTSEEATMLQQAAPQLDLRHLLTCGIILAGLGILNDVTITQSSAVWELHEAGADAGRLRLYRQAMRIGRDHIASTVYTIVFAYAGAALSVLLLISMADTPLSMILTSNDISEELVRTMASVIGLVLAMPATTALAVLVVTSRRRVEDRPAEPRPERADEGEAETVIGSEALVPTSV